MRIQEMSTKTCPRILLENVVGVTVARFSETEIIDERVIDDVDEQLRELAGDGIWPPCC